MTKTEHFWAVVVELVKCVRVLGWRVTARELTRGLRDGWSWGWALVAS